MNPLRVFIGYDPRDRSAYHVLSHSILVRASRPVSIQPVMLSQLNAVYTRKRGAVESTEFSISRFLVPHLSNYEGISIFMDCDMLCRADIHTLHDLVKANPEKAVWVVQHSYIPKHAIKADGKVQTAYPRKNWSSLMVFDNSKCRALTPEYVNRVPALELHRFRWLMDDQIGWLPPSWNWLVGEYDPDPNAQILHYTTGGPWLSNCRDVDHADLWLKEYHDMIGEMETSKT